MTVTMNNEIHNDDYIADNNDIDDDNGNDDQNDRTVVVAMTMTLNSVA